MGAALIIDKIFNTNQQLYVFITVSGKLKDTDFITITNFINETTQECSNICITCGTKCTEEHSCDCIVNDNDFGFGV